MRVPPDSSTNHGARKRVIQGLWGFLLLNLLWPTSAALAHEAETATRMESWVAGVTHPIFGFDHLVVMLCIGAISARHGNQMVWKLPAAFVAALIGGFVGGLLSFSVVALELIILGSAIALSVALIARHLLSNGAILAVAVAAGFVHGNAHGLEMASSYSPWAFSIGFILVSAALHVAGMGLTLFTAGRSRLRMTIAVLLLGITVVPTI